MPDKHCACTEDCTVILPRDRMRVWFTSKDASVHVDVFCWWAMMEGGRAEAAFAFRREGGIGAWD